VGATAGTDRTATKVSTKSTPVTVVNVEIGTLSIPKNKHYLNSLGSVKCCYTCSSDTYDTVESKLSELFGERVDVLVATQSGDLFPATTFENGEELLKMIGNRCLYVTPHCTKPLIVSSNKSSEKPIDLNEKCKLLFVFYVHIDHIVAFAHLKLVNPKEECMDYMKSKKLSKYDFKIN
jgi:hypothetical protein